TPSSRSEEGLALRRRMRDAGGGGMRRFLLVHPCETGEASTGSAQRSCLDASAGGRICARPPFRRRLSLAAFGRHREPPDGRRRHAIDRTGLPVPANETHLAATLTQARERGARRVRQPACGAGQFIERCALVGREHPEDLIELRAGAGRAPGWFACAAEVLIHSTFRSRVLNWSR